MPSPPAGAPAAAAPLAVVLLAALVACSGDAVIGVVHDRSTQGSCLQAPDPVGTVDPAGCSRSEIEPCSFSCPDEAGHTFGMRCDEQSCSCTHDGAPVCTCSVSGEADICGGLAPCCPPPWPIP